MGEFAKRKSDGAEIKIGTCEMMYYLRYEDKDKVIKLDSSLDPSIETGLFFRLPMPSEDDLLLGEYSYPMPTVYLYKLKDGETEHFNDSDTLKSPGLLQLRHDNGILINVTCYHGIKLPENSKDLHSFWNGKSPYNFVLSSIKSLPNGKTRPVVKCRHCSASFSYDWDDIFDYISDRELKDRLNKYRKQSEND
jgi:hypothetical protein